MSILMSFDIDGTMEVGDPPGAVTMEMVRNARARGIVTGSCSDRPMSTQRAIWEKYGVEYDFVCYKHMLPDLKDQFDADEFYHVGDRDDLDRKFAIRAGFGFFWPDEAAEHPLLITDGS
ncbi:MAG: HAD family hydrolase [SAR202 cluster bacterium]|nr:MAG: HAD family hydrolase [SAR202 cluster bacterium]